MPPAAAKLSVCYLIGLPAPGLRTKCPAVAVAADYKSAGMRNNYLYPLLHFSFSAMCFVISPRSDCGSDIQTGQINRYRIGVNIAVGKYNIGDGIITIVFQVF